MRDDGAWLRAGEFESTFVQIIPGCRGERDHLAVDEAYGVSEARVLNGARPGLHRDVERGRGRRAVDGSSALQKLHVAGKLGGGQAEPRLALRVHRVLCDRG